MEPSWLEEEVKSCQVAAWKKGDNWKFIALERIKKGQSQLKILVD